MRKVIEIPLGLGGVNGILEATVVAEDVPLLIPVRLLRELRAVVDFSTESVFFKKHGTQTTMSDNSPLWTCISECHRVCKWSSGTSQRGSGERNFQGRL